MHTTRRSLLAAAAAGSTLLRAQENPIPIIDTHFHLYDQTRPQGAPYPFTPNAPPFLPRDYRESAKPLGIVGGIEVEASPWVEDNLWVLMQIEKEPIIVGTVGNIDPAKCDFQDFLERYYRNKLFLGIRYGNVWKGQDLVTAINKPDFIENMKVFARTGLTLEVANPRLDLIEATLRLSDKAPDLRIVLGHLQALPLPSEQGALKSYTNNLRELRKRRAFAKVSGLPKANPQAAFDPAVYKPTLDLIWDVFGEDYVVYAGKNKEALDILKAYTMAMGRPAAEKFFWKNSIPAFRWIKRDAEQPQVG
jgi:predicted TIM-barrel fold metal-dependent hydrolase